MAPKRSVKSHARRTPSNVATPLPAPRVCRREGLRPRRHTIEVRAMSRAPPNSWPEREDARVVGVLHSDVGEATQLSTQRPRHNRAGRPEHQTTRARQPNPEATATGGTHAPRMTALTQQLRLRLNAQRPGADQTGRVTSEFSRFHP